MTARPVATPSRRVDREVSMRDETVFRVTNSRYHANPSSDRVCFRRRCNDSTFQRITTAKRNVLLITRHDE
jgi:hypothetical protein